MSRKVWKFLKDVLQHFMEDEATTRAGSVAYYAALSLAPMVLLFIAITGFIGARTQENMIQSVERTVGSQIAAVVRRVSAKGGEQTEEATLSLVVSIVLILFSASGVVAALQRGLNRIWNIKPAPGQGLKGWMRKRLISMAMVLAFALLLLFSLVLNSVIGMVLPSAGWLWGLADMAASFLLFILLFASIFKVLPDAQIAWKDVWLGAAVTAALFAVGEYFIGMYIARADYSRSYGTAGSIIALLVWVYFGSLMVFLGAEVTQVVASRRGRSIRPDRHAVHFEHVVDGEGAE
ncbi:MAG: YihY/virulence factor BrkB family protein [Phycisphaerae bacterium]